MKTRHLLALVAVVALIAGGTGVAVANHQWSDVPTGNAFHDSIDNFSNAGCATGFPNGTFRPDEPVKRQQMARFVNSCGGRVDYDSDEASNVGATKVDLLNLQMTSGAQQGAGLVIVHADIHVSTNSDAPAAFPCEMSANFSPGTGGTVYIDLPGNTADPIEDANGSISAAFPLPAGLNTNLFLEVRKVNGCTADVFVTATGYAMYFPFDGSGAGGGEVVGFGEEPGPESGPQDGRG